jgi:hypothetical protein
MRTLCGLVLAGAMLPLLLANTSAPHRHLRLVRAEPAADSTLAASPTALRFFFSERPEIRATTIRLLADGTTAVELTEPRLDTSVTGLVIADLRSPVPTGTHLVAWRAMSRDGHIVTGEFRFTVRPADH